MGALGVLGFSVCLLTGLVGLLDGLGRIQNKSRKYPASIQFVLNHLFTDTLRICIGGVSGAYRYRIRYPIPIRWLPEVSVHARSVLS